MNLFLQIAAYHALTSITLLFALGIAVGYRLPLPASSGVIVATAVGLFLATAGVICWRRPFSATARLALLTPASFLLGLVHISATLQLPAATEHLYYHFDEKKEAVIAGFLQNMPASNGQITSVVIDSRWIRLPKDQAFTKTQGKILLRLQGEWPRHILPGDGIIVRADIKRPKSYQTPGAFDYARYLAEKGILLTGFIRSPLFLQKTGERPQKRLQTRMERYRAIIAAALNRQLPPQQAGLYRAILLGDRSGIPPPVLENFKACGVLHLLAISGLHLAVIWSLFHFIWYWLLSRSEYILLHYPVHILAALLTLPFILLYTFLAGLQTPVLRAAIMSATLVLALIRGQQTTAAPLLSGAALLLLLIQPMQLFSPSFQLSFVAVAVIFLLLPLLKRVLRQPEERYKKSHYSKRICQNIWRWIMAAFLLSGGISLLTAPITALHFNRLSLVGAFTNLLLEPLLCLWALPCGIFAIPSLVAGKGAGLLLSFGATGLELATDVLARAATLPFAFYWVPTAEPLFLWGTRLFYGGLFLLALGRVKVADTDDNRMTAFSKKTSLAGVGIVLLSLPLLFVTPPRQNRMVFLDVGQGSATLIEFADGASVLVDGGGASFASTSVGERVIAPYLLHKGRKKLDAVVLTHPDADHSNGLDHLLASFSVNTLWVRAVDEDHPLHKKLLETARQKGTAIAVPKAGDALLPEKTQALSCLYNFGRPQHSSTAEKNRGLVVVADNGCRLLLPGDIDKKGERQLLDKNVPVQSQIFLASHHGSKTSNAKEFIEAVHPRLVIVSAGEKRQLFPSAALRRYLRDRKIPLLTTAEKGTIEIETNRKGMKIRYYTKEKGSPLLPYHYKEERITLQERAGSDAPTVTAKSITLPWMTFTPR